MKKLLLIYILASLMVLTYSIIVYSQSVTWYRTWGLQGIQRGEQGIRVCQTFDGGYAVFTGVSNGGNGWYDLLKYDYLGNLQWVNVIIDSTTTGRHLIDMQQTSDSGFIFAGWSSGALLVKTDKNGNLKWQRNYTNLNSGTRFRSVKQTRDKGYIACGDYIDYGNPSMKGIVIKVDSLGFVQWEKQFTDSLFNPYYGVIQGFDRNYFVVGSTANNQSPDYSMLKKLDTLGNVLNTNIFYPNSFIEFIIQLKDSSLITGGKDNISEYPLIAKFHPTGTIKWLKTYPLQPLERYYFYDMSKDLFDNILMTGNFEKGGYNSTIGIWKLDTSGTILKIKKVEYSGYSIIGAHCIKPTIDSGYILTGVITLLGNHDALIIKTDSAFNSPIITGIQNIHYSVPEKFKIYQNYPNPFNASTLIKFYIPKNGIVNISIYDLLGKIVFSNKEIRTKGLNEKIINMNNMNLSSGIYFVRINFESNSELIKLVYLK